MRAAILGFVAGVVLLQCQAHLPSWQLTLLLLLGAIGFGVLAHRFRNQKMSHVLRCGCGVAAGIVWASLLAYQALQHALPQEWEGRDVTVIGTVANLPSRFDRGVRFQFAVERAFHDGQVVVGVPPKIALSWYGKPGGHAGKFADSSVPAIQAGARWQLTVRLKRPHGNANPYGFDYEAWLLEQRIRATGYVRSDEKRAYKNVKQDAFVFSFGSAIHSVRGWLRDRIESALPHAPYAGVLVALVIGEQRAIPSVDWEIFTRTGISHLVSISGLHITMIAGMMAMLMATLWRRSFFTRAQLPLRIPTQKIAALTGAVVALLYVLLAGFGVPAQRTLYMLTVVALALWQGRLTNVSHVMLLALGAVLLLDPWAVLWPGFWLSFAAVGVILYVSVGRAFQGQTRPLSTGQGIWHALQTASRTQYAVTIGLVPLTMLLFGQVSLISPLANAIAIPLISLLVTPLALLGSVLPVPVATEVLSFAHLCLSALVACLSWMSHFTWVVWSAPLPSIPIFIIALAGTIWMLAPRAWPARWLGIFCWLPLIFNAPSHPLESEAWVTVFDVGQGSAVLIETRHHRLLYDTGPAYSPESDGGNRVVLPYLRGRGIHAIDKMIVSHKDSDHSGGALSILKSSRVDEVYASLPQESPITQFSSKQRPCRSGEIWVWEGVRFAVLHPDAAAYAKPNKKSNEISCVLKVSVGAQSLLLTGDISKAEEAVLIARYGKDLRATVLLAPHHGGAHSSSASFLETVKPQWAVFQVGYRNRYHHPRPDVIERYESLGIPYLRTDASGAIRFALERDGEPETYRQSAARYWRHQ
ncbi:MAG: DNA internalization-related competence protein ComEC/Rec2 [Oxalobacter sp.]|nr:MAG: DNA internalization-related competence protein ComEC/Rec2 [Oxalobacter sp.]